jgi:hypothetical protein
MPPVRHQSPTSWCATFTAECLISYHNFSTAVAMGEARDPKEFYQKKGRPSVVDLRAAGTRFNQNKDVLNINGGGEAFDQLYVLQNENYKCRSDALIGFTSVLENNPRAAELARQVLERYKSKDEKARAYVFTYGGRDLTCRLNNSQLSRLSTELQDVITSIQSVNFQLHARAAKTGNLTSKYELENYSSIVKDIPKDYTSSPFTVERLYVADPKIFLQGLSRAFNNGEGVPVEVGLCGDDLPNGSQSPDACGAHSILVTGAGWENGQCKIKLRNSWGPDWPNKGDGTLDISVDKFIEMSRKYITKARINPSGYSATWLKQPDPNQPQYAVRASGLKFSDGSVFTGVMTHDKKNNLMNYHDGTLEVENRRIKFLKGQQISD